MREDENEEEILTYPIFLCVSLLLVSLQWRVRYVSICLCIYVLFDRITVTHQSCFFPSSSILFLCIFHRIYSISLIRYTFNNKHIIYIHIKMFNIIHIITSLLNQPKKKIFFIFFLCSQQVPLTNSICFRTIKPSLFTHHYEFVEYMCIPIHISKQSLRTSVFCDDKWHTQCVK